MSSNLLYSNFETELKVLKLVKPDDPLISFLGNFWTPIQLTQFSILYILPSLHFFLFLNQHIFPCSCNWLFFLDRRSIYIFVVNIYLRFSLIFETLSLAILVKHFVANKNNLRLTSLWKIGQFITTIHRIQKKSFLEFHEETSKKYEAVKDSYIFPTFFKILSALEFHGLSSLHSSFKGHIFLFFHLCRLVLLQRDSSHTLCSNDLSSNNKDMLVLLTSN